jgi:formylglycine-generating enzyme required for sulfatase activity
MSSSQQQQGGQPAGQPTASPFVYRATRAGIPVTPPEPPPKPRTPWGILALAAVVVAAGILVYVIVREDPSAPASRAAVQPPSEAGAPSPAQPPANGTAPTRRPADAASAAAARATANALMDAARALSDGRSAPELTRALILASNANSDEAAGRYEAAEEQWNQAARTAGALAFMLALARLDASVAAIPVANVRDFQPDRWRAFDALRSQASAAQRSGDFTAALRLVDEAANTMPSLLEGVADQLSQLAAGARNQGDAASALAFSLQLHQLRPGDAATLDYLHQHRFVPGEILVSPTGVRLAWIPPGSFTQGSPASEAGRGPDETEREVTLTRGFFLSTTEITQAQWDAVMPAELHAATLLAGNAPNFIGPNLPMHSVTHEQALEFCQRLSEREGTTYRLPTEAEWEYACRAGTATAFWQGAALSALEANIDDGSAAVRAAPAPVATLGSANAWGLWDVHGNVWEWCADWYGNYAPGPVTNPAGIADAEIGRSDLAMRVARGGGWFHDANWARSANRWEYSPVVAVNYIGFRVARSVDRFPLP